MLFPTRLFWAGNRGFAQCDGVYAALNTRPELPGLPEMTEMDYVSGLCATVREGCDARRDMTGNECVAVHRWLQGRAAAAHDAMTAETTIVVVSK